MNRSPCPDFLCRHYTLIALVIITTAAAWLRFKNLAFQSYWLDEMETLYLSQPDNGFIQVIKFALADKTTPLYQVLQWVWFHLFGFSEYTGRSLPAMLGVSSVIAMYFLAREYINNRAGILAAIITCTNQVLIYYSQEARSYQLLFLLSALTLLFLSRMLRLKNKRELAFYTILSICLVQTHYYGILVYLAQATFILLHGYFRDSRIKKLFNINVIFTLFSLAPAIPYLYKNALNQSFWIEKPQPNFLIEYFKIYFTNPDLAMVFAILSAIGIFYLFRTKEAGRKNILLLAALSLVFIYLIPYLRSLVSTPMLLPKYTLGILPVILLLTCAGLESLEYKNTRMYILVFTVIFSLGVLFMENDYYSEINKAQYRDALQIITDRDKSPVVFCYHHRGLMIYARLLGHDIDFRRNTPDSLNEINGDFWYLSRFDNQEEWQALLDDEFNFINKKHILLDKNIEKHNLRILHYIYKKDQAR